MKQSLESLVRQGSGNYRRKPGKDLNDLITTTAMGTMPGLPAAILASTLKHIANLEDCSHRPRQLKKPIYSTELVEVVLRLREDIPLEEFCEVTENSFNLSELKDELLEWEEVYNTVRAHQALGYVIPLKFLEQWKECQEGRMCH